ncbi:peptidase C55 [Ralstonia pseudosolanacearum]|nr:peptidase C55 [Ralstonia pseudosolanacearum]
MKRFMRAIGVGSSRSTRTNYVEPQADDAPDSNASSNSSPERPTLRRSPNPAFASLPPRAKDKAVALDNSLRRNLNYIPSDLENYARAALNRVEYTATSGEMTDLDIENIHHLVGAYNDRFSGLHLKNHESPRSFFEEFMDSGESVWRSVVRLSMNDRHHVAIDVRVDDDKRTMIIIESALAHNPRQPGVFLQGYEQLSGKLASYAGDDGGMAVVELGVQKSNYDCIIYSLNNSLAAYQKNEVFDEMHASLREIGRCFGRYDGKSTIQSGIELIDGSKVLPAIFFKHAHSRATIDDVLENQPDLEGRNVSTGSENPHQTLSQRVRDFRIERDDRGYSMSIEASRLRKIRKAIER